MDVKQVIVIRRDLGMRRGKEIAQGAHASMLWLTLKLHPSMPVEYPNILHATFTDAERSWIKGLFTKVVCQVKSEEELLAVLDKAREAGVTAYAVTDAGKTEFHGEPTLTAVAVGPDRTKRVDAVTAGLRLY